jgi:molybdenum cofactor biosynthesis enzyme MoaA
MDSSFSDLHDILPPLRLILSNACEGKCFFCHAEGFNSPENVVMKNEILAEAACAINDLHLNKVIVSGGELTLIHDLPERIAYLHNRINEPNISLVTNGSHLLEHIDNLANLLNGLSVSIMSFKRDVIRRFSGVEPFPVLEALSESSIIRKTANIVVTNYNVNEVAEMTAYCLSKNISVEIMFPIQERYLSRHLEKALATSIHDIYSFDSIALQYTPVLEAHITHGLTVRIKQPRYSKLVKWSICVGCVHRNVCSEGVCGVRVDPLGHVYACIIKRKDKQTDISSSTYQSIINTYSNLIGQRKSAIEFLV